jgi:hypothetical protein
VSLHARSRRIACSVAAAAELPGGCSGVALATTLMVLDQ